MSNYLLIPTSFSRLKKKAEIHKTRRDQEKINHRLEGNLVASESSSCHTEKELLTRTIHQY